MHRSRLRPQDRREANTKLPGALTEEEARAKKAHGDLPTSSKVEVRHAQKR